MAHVRNLFHLLGSCIVGFFPFSNIIALPAMALLNIWGTRHFETTWSVPIISAIYIFLSFGFATPTFLKGDHIFFSLYFFMNIGTLVHWFWYKYRAKAN